LSTNAKIKTQCWTVYLDGRVISVNASNRVAAVKKAFQTDIQQYGIEITTLKGADEKSSPFFVARLANGGCRIVIATNKQQVWTVISKETGKPPQRISQVVLEGPRTKRQSVKSLHGVSVLSPPTTGKINLPPCHTKIETLCLNCREPINGDEDFCPHCNEDLNDPSALK
jgi:hypothetical protein